jgi:uncharacterized membrane protein HdeD (DUF308 family)
MTPIRREEAAMTDKAMAMAREYAPWREGARWWVIGIQGGVLVAIGLFLLLAPGSAGRVIVQLISLAVLVQSIIFIAEGLRGPRDAADPYQMLQAGVGATIGLLLILRSWLLPTLDAESALTILGLGLLAYAAIGVAGAVIGRDQPQIRPARIINAALLVVLSLTLLTSNESNASDRLAALGWIALVGGALLLVLAWLAHNRASSATAGSPA